MDIKITAGGVYGGDGEEIKVGTVLKGLEAVPVGLEGRHEVIGAESVLVVNPAAEGVTGGPPYEVRETSPGWYQIYDAAGAEVGKKLRKDDAETFQGLTVEQQAEFLAGEA